MYRPEKIELPCVTHGVFAGYRFSDGRTTPCPACLMAEEAAGIALARARSQERRLQRAIDDSGIPPRFTSVSIDGFEADEPRQFEAKVFAQRLSADLIAGSTPGRSAVFCGLPNTGKTHMACAIALDLLRAGHTARYTTVYRAMRAIKSTWGDLAQQSELQVVSVFESPDFLILDEFGARAASEVEKTLLFDLLDARYGARRSTLILSNLDHAETRAALGAQIARRLREDGGEIIPFDWSTRKHSEGPHGLHSAT